MLDDALDTQNYYQVMRAQKNKQELSYIRIYNYRNDTVRIIPMDATDPKEVVASIDVTDNRIFYTDGAGSLYCMTKNGDAKIRLTESLRDKDTFIYCPGDVKVIGNTVYFLAVRQPPTPDPFWDVTRAVIAVPACGGKPAFLEYWVERSYHMS